MFEFEFPTRTGVGENQLGALAIEQALVGHWLESISATKKMIPDLPAVVRPRHSWHRTIDLRDDVRLVRVVIPDFAHNEIDFGHLEAGYGHVEVQL
jgi:hypothetical protein